MTGTFKITFGNDGLDETDTNIAMSQFSKGIYFQKHGTSDLTGIFKKA